mmetsp:Transcript_70920/g.203218  ORF Transcript_70920/g.203218 Transcript_70920/m.203218 type:complete len:286 (-) Transcript_70920:166-1023(-)
MHVREGYRCRDHHSDVLEQNSECVAELHHVLGKPIFDSVGLVRVLHDLQPDLHQDGARLSHVGRGVDFVLGVQRLLQDILNGLFSQQGRALRDVRLVVDRHQIVHLLKFGARQQSSQAKPVHVDHSLCLTIDHRAHVAAVADACMQPQRDREGEGQSHNIHACQARPDVIDVLQIRIELVCLSPVVCSSSSLDVDAQGHDKISQPRKDLLEVGSTLPITFRRGVGAKHQQVRHRGAEDRLPRTARHDVAELLRCPHCEAANHNDHRGKQRLRPYRTLVAEDQSHP